MSCDRLEREKLLSELGDVLDPHVEQCDDCRERLRGYEHIMRWIAEGTTARRLPPDWKQRTLARIDVLVGAMRDSATAPADPTPRTVAPRSSPPRWRRALASSAVAMPVAALLMCLVHFEGTPDPKSGAPVVQSGAPHEVMLKEVLLARHSVENEGWWASPKHVAAAPAMQQFWAQPGQVVHARALFTGARYREIRVYRGDGDLVVRCPTAGPPVCEQRDGSLFVPRPPRASDVIDLDPSGDAPSRLVWKIPLFGNYRVVFLASQQPIAPPRGLLNDDVAAAIAAGADASDAGTVQVH